MIHCDVMDGHFVPNITFGPLLVKSLKKITKLPLDVHLMINSPDKFLEDFISAGASYVTVHIEEVIHIHRTIQKIKDLGVKAGVAINPGTSISSLSSILQFVDLLLIMTVNPGFGGQAFIGEMLTKIEEVYRLRKEMKLNFQIEIDGGINSSNIGLISNAGCDIFVVGSSIFKSDNISAAAAELKNSVTS